MAITRALLEEVQRFKAQGLGSQQALGHVRCQQFYTPLRKTLAQRIDAERLPSVEEIMQVTDRFYGLLYHVQLNDVQTDCLVENKLKQDITDDVRRVRKILHDEFPAYFELTDVINALRERLPPAEAKLRAQEVASRVHRVYSALASTYFGMRDLTLQNQIGDLPMNGASQQVLAKLVLKILLDVEPVQLNYVVRPEETTLPRAIGLTYGPLYRCTEPFKFSLQEGALSAYEHGVLNQTLQQQDVARSIAQAYIHLNTDPADTAEMRVNGAIATVRRDIRTNSTKSASKEWCSDADFAKVTLYRIFGNASDLPANMQPQVPCKTPQQLIYPLLQGTATESDARAYLLLRDRYVLQAIMDHEDWLIKITA